MTLENKGNEQVLTESIDDCFIATITPKELSKKNKNMYPVSLKFPQTIEEIINKVARKKIINKKEKSRIYDFILQLGNPYKYGIISLKQLTKAGAKCVINDVDYKRIEPLAKINMVRITEKILAISSLQRHLIEKDSYLRGVGIIKSQANILLAHSLCWESELTHKLCLLNVDLTNKEKFKLLNEAYELGKKSGYKLINMNSGEEVYEEYAAKSFNHASAVLGSLLYYVEFSEEIEQNQKNSNRIEQNYLVDAIKNSKIAIGLASEERTIIEAKLNYINFTKRLCHFHKVDQYIHKSKRYLNCLTELKEKSTNQNLYDLKTDNLNGNTIFFRNLKGEKKKKQKKNKKSYRPKKNKKRYYK